MKKKIVKKESVKINKNLEWVLRLGVFGTFLGHGVFALMGKQAWIKYFLAVNIPEPAAQTLLPLIGIADILVAVFVLFKPLRIVLGWAVFWAFITALIRPISGEPIWDFIERSANFMAPLALLILYSLPKKLKDWFK